MHVTVQLPDSIARQLAPLVGDIPRRILEAVAIDGYRSEQVSRGQVSEILGLNFWETEAFLKERGGHLHYSNEDLDQDVRANQRTLGR